MSLLLTKTGGVSAPVAPQDLRPLTDVGSPFGWTAVGEATLSLATRDQSDATYITDNAGTSGDPCTRQLDPGTNPTTAATIVVRTRARIGGPFIPGDEPKVQYTVTIDGVTVATSPQITLIDTTIQDYSYSFSGAEITAALAQSDWGNIRFITHAFFINPTDSVRIMDDYLDVD